MSYTRAQWSTDLLAAIGNVNPAGFTLAFVIGWTRQESQPESQGPVAAYNLLNTTEPNTPGVVSDFNPAGVKNYDTYADGIQANAKVLQNGLYGSLLAALVGDDVLALGSITNTPSQGVQDNLATWGTHNWQGILQLAQQSDTLGKEKFSGDAGSGNGTGNNNLQNGLGKFLGSVTPSDQTLKGLAQALSEIDAASAVSNPFKVPKAQQGNAFLDFIDPVAAVEDSTQGAINTALAVGNNLALDMRGVMIRTLIALIGFALVAYVLLSFINFSDIKAQFSKLQQQAQQAGQTAALAAA